MERKHSRCLYLWVIVIARGSRWCIPTLSHSQWANITEKDKATRCLDYHRLSHQPVHPQLDPSSVLLVDLTSHTWVCLRGPIRNGEHEASRYNYNHRLPHRPVHPQLDPSCVLLVLFSSFLRIPGLIFLLYPLVAYSLNANPSLPPSLYRWICSSAYPAKKLFFILVQQCSSTPQSVTTSFDATQWSVLSIPSKVRIPLAYLTHQSLSDFPITSLPNKHSILPMLHCLV